MYFFMLQLHNNFCVCIVIVVLFFMLQQRKNIACIVIGVLCSFHATSVRCRHEEDEIMKTKEERKAH